MDTAGGDLSGEADARAAKDAPARGSLARFRPGARAVIPRPALPAGGRTPRAAAGDAPHHLGRLVDGHPEPGAGRALSRLRSRRDLDAAGASLQYRDFARWQRSWLRARRSKSACVLALASGGAPQVLELPTDRPRPSLESHRGANYSFTLPLELAQALRGLARREGATLFMTLLAGFTLLLSRYSGQEDLLVGTPVANRSRAEIEDARRLLRQHPGVARRSVRRSFGQRVPARMREVCLDAYAHQDLPFERLVEELQPERDLSRNPLFQVMFALQNAPLERAASCRGSR